MSKPERSPRGSTRTDGSPRFFSWRVGVRGLADALGVLAGFGTVAGFLGAAGWAFDLASHFRVQYFVVLACVAALALACRRFRVAAVAGALTLVNASVVAPLYVPPPRAVPPRGSVPFRLLLANVHTPNRSFDRVCDTVRRERADVVIAEEIDGAWASALHDLTNDYPYAILKPRDDNFGIAVLSRLPMERSRILYLGEAGVPSILTRVHAGDATVTLLATHPPPPVSPVYARWRNDQLESLGEFVRQCSGPLVVAGDLNVTPWSHPFRRLLQQSGLEDSLRGFGVQATWPTMRFVMRIPVDHVLHSSGIRVTARRLGPNVGSDHYPVVADLLADPSSVVPAHDHASRPDAPPPD